MPHIPQGTTDTVALELFDPALDAALRRVRPGTYRIRVIHGHHGGTALGTQQMLVVGVKLLKTVYNSKNHKK